MFFSSTRNTLFVLLITFSFTGLYSGQIPSGFNGVSSQFFPTLEAELDYLDEAGSDIDVNASEYETEVKSRISKIIAKYSPGSKKNKKKYSKMPEWIFNESRKYGYDPLFLTALIATESSFNTSAKSNRGAIGLMQIRPTTGSALASETQIDWKGKPTLYDPETNIALGVYYLNKLVLRFGDLGLALEAYNHGPSKLNGYLKKGYRPNKYSQKVMKKYKRIRSWGI